MGINATYPVNFSEMTDMLPQIQHKFTFSSERAVAH